MLSEIHEDLAFPVRVVGEIGCAVNVLPLLSYLSHCAADKEEAGADD